MKTNNVKLKCKLKPCPFCGDEACLTRNPHKPEFLVMCTNPRCKAYVLVKNANPVIAVENWNTRANEKCQDNSN